MSRLAAARRGSVRGGWLSAEPVAPERGEPQHHQRRCRRSPAARRPTIVRAGPTRSPSVPCSRSASRGPPATTRKNTPCIRPRISSVAAVCRMAPRNTMLTRSAAPASARNTAATHSLPDSPNAAIAAPQAITAIAVAAPCRRSRVNEPENSPAANAPGRDRGVQHAERDPAAGRVAEGPLGELGEQRPRHARATMAMMSARNETSSTACSRDVPQPLDDRAQPGAGPLRRPRAAVGGMAGSRNTAYSAASSATLSIRYSQDSPSSGISAPASSGPDHRAEPEHGGAQRVRGRPARSAGTSRGIAAPRAGLFSPKHACCTAEQHQHQPHLACCPAPPGRTARTRSARCPRSSPAASCAGPRRRRWLPPHSAKKASGTSATRPLSPTYADDPVSSKICLGTATAVSWAPTVVTTVDSHSLRYAGWRSGAVSTTSRRHRGTGGALTLRTLRQRARVRRGWVRSLAVARLGRRACGFSRRRKSGSSSGPRGALLERGVGPPADAGRHSAGPAVRAAGRPAISQASAPTSGTSTMSMIQRDLGQVAHPRRPPSGCSRSGSRRAGRARPGTAPLCSTSPPQTREAYSDSTSRAKSSMTLLRLQLHRRRQVPGVLGPGSPAGSRTGGSARRRTRWRWPRRPRSGRRPGPARRG